VSPTQRTQQLLRESGYTVANCERKLPATPAGYRGHLITQDLFGFIDTLAVKNTGRLIAVQSTSNNGGNHAAHVKKVLASKAARLLVYHMDIAVWSWAKRGPRGQPKVWTLRDEDLTARLLPKRSLLRRHLEQGTWEIEPERKE
jgi:hypothetical protein